MIRAALLTLASILPFSAVAQQAVPLSDELFDYAWVVIDYEGQSDAPVIAPTTFYVFDRGDGDLGGQSPCDVDWNAKIEIDLPAVRITDVHGFNSDECPAFRDVNAFFAALEQVTQAQTSPEGLELLAEDGRRLLLMVAGG